jgi:hypothetical protein
MVGVGSVFSREYYELGASRLKEGGIMAQWFHVYDMHDGIIGLVLRTFGSVFPYVEIWDCRSGDLVLLGSKTPWAATVETYQQVFDREGPRKDLARIGLHSPAALLARQLASQRTAFAIAGEGPIQADLFPILEYEAPRAFYLGARSTMLAEFDERTRQADLAPAEKYRVLEALDDATLKAVFGEHHSINEELFRQLQLRLYGGWIPGSGSEAPSPVLPGVFAPPQRTAANPNPPQAANDEVKQLLQAAHLIESRTDRTPEGVNAIAALLRSYHAKSGWPPARYAALAARASLGRGDAAKAQEILRAALRLAPEDRQLRYLARVASREAERRSRPTQFSLVE